MRLTRRTFLLGSLATAVACGAPGSAGRDAASPAAGPGPGSTAAAGSGPGSVPGTSATTPAAPGSTASAGPASAPSTTSTSTAPSTTAHPAPTPSTAPTTAAPAPAPATFVDRGPDGDRVALTFHTNGDLALAQRLLDVFAAKGAVMTNFIVGNWLAANPSWAAKLTGAGHELANHTYTHPTFGSLSPAAMVDEIVRCRDVVAKLTGNGGRFFRPSGTDDGTARPSAAILQAAAGAGYATVLGWDDEPYDYQDPGADAVRTRVLDQVRGGSIVSLHFGHPGTVDAMPGILDGLAARGLKTVTVSQLLG